jgi:uncharacterized protein (UPF0332 family)
MSHNTNKVEWCLKKGEKEGTKHRGLIKVKRNDKIIEAHIKKAEHNLNAIIDFKKTGYSDWSASAAFYSIYHCFLAIINKFGYESRNQECTFALIYTLIEDKKIDLDKEIVEEINNMDVEEKQETPIIELRETEQYGISLSIDDKAYERILEIAQKILDKTKEILEA